jgi:hypothetical protein
VAALFVVEGDAVQGVDRHKVKGDATSASGTVPYLGVGKFTYEGTMSGRLSDFVSVNGVPVALTSSRSRLKAGEDLFPTGRHTGPRGSGFDPTNPGLIPLSLTILDPIGEGVPSADAGSGLVSVGDQQVLLDGDAIDTCDGLGGTANSTVTSSAQDFVRASE